MPGGTLFTLSVLFAIVAGTSAGILSLLLLEVLWRSPFGRAVLVLSLVMAVFVLYHATLIISPGHLVFAETVKSATYTGVAVFVWVMVWGQHRIQHRSAGEVNA